MKDRLNEQIVSLTCVVRKGCYSAQQKRDDDGECGGYAAHTKSIAKPKKNAHMRPNQLATNQYL